MSALSVAGASWRLKPRDRQFLTSHYLPWALQAGTRCADLMSLRYEHHFQVWWGPACIAGPRAMRREGVSL